MSHHMYPNLDGLLTCAYVAAQHGNVPPYAKVLPVATSHVRNHATGGDGVDELAHLGPYGEAALVGGWQSRQTSSEVV